MAYPYGRQAAAMAVGPPQRPRIGTVRDAWGGRSIVADTIDAAVNWLRDVTRRATQYVVSAFQAHPIAGGVLVVGLIGGAFVVAPAASWALLKRAAAYLARNAGRVIAATALAEVCPECWIYT